MPSSKHAVLSLIASSLLAQVALAQEANQQVTAWMNQQAIPVKSITPSADVADLAPLKTVLKGVRVVGLGEATHGTREFFQFKHRMLQYLVRELQFNVFAIEANYATTRVIDDYVMGAEVDRKTLLAGLFRIYRTEEVMQLIEWLRAYNRGAAPARKVRFYGIDMQESARAAAVVSEYLRAAAPELLEPAAAVIDAVGAFSISEREKMPAAECARLQAGLQALIAQVVLAEARLVQRSSAEKYANALQHLRLLSQYVEHAPNVDSSNPFATRDRFMALNAQHAMNNAGPAARMVVWAHNFHVFAFRDPGDPAQARLGTYLKDAFGAAYYAFGFVFGEGSFRAYDEAAGGFRDVASGLPPQGSLDWQLARVSKRDFILDLRRRSPDEAVQRWLNALQRSRQPGMSAPSDIDEQWVAGKGLASFTLAAFDGLIFIANTTGARHIGGS